MAERAWIRNGPRVFGYEPGWLWWAVAFVVVCAGLFWGSFELDRQRRNVAYLHERAAFHSAEQSLDQALVFAVIEAESSWDWRAHSPVGAKGLMQVTDIALEDVQAARTNRQRKPLRGGLQPARRHAVPGVLARSVRWRCRAGRGGVHMGPTAIAKGQRKYPNLSPRDMINKHGGPQTRAYVKKVLKLFETNQQE